MSGCRLALKPRGTQFPPQPGISTANINLNFSLSRVGVRTAPSVIASMSEGSSSPASPFRPVPASELQETVTPVSHVFGLSEVSASLEALNIEVEKKPYVVHHAQTSYSPGASRISGSPNTRDHRRSRPVSPQKPKRYALQICLEVEVGPGYFVPPRTIPVPWISPSRF